MLVIEGSAEGHVLWTGDDETCRSTNPVPLLPAAIVMVHWYRPLKLSSTLRSVSTPSLCDAPVTTMKFQDEISQNNPTIIV